MANERQNTISNLGDQIYWAAEFNSVLTLLKWIPRKKNKQ